MDVETRGQRVSQKATLAESTSQKEPLICLRDTSFSEIFGHFDSYWNTDNVRVRVAPEGQTIRLPADWHGAIKYDRPNIGDAVVLFGPHFTDSIEGTRLPAATFIDGLKQLGFVFEDGLSRPLSGENAASIISSDTSCQASSDGEEIPIFRAVKNDDQGKIIVEVRNGSMSAVMQELTRLGNDPDLDPKKKIRYRTAVSECLGEFSAKGATAVRKRLGLYEYARLTRFDDCLASGVTIIGDQEVDDAMRRFHPKTLEEIRVAVASTQGIAIAIKRALDRRVPLLIRVGALSYGLGSKEIGANYLINTQPEMTDIGTFTVGDMGDRLATGREPRITPHIRLYGSGKNETRIYLGGGLAMLELWEDKIRERNKTPDPVVVVLKASRINPPESVDGSVSDWGVLLKGKRLAPENRSSKT